MLKSVLASLLVLAANGLGATAAEPLLKRIRLRPDAPYADAVMVRDAALAHTAQILPIAGKRGAPAQCESVLQQLDDFLARYESRREDLVKLNLYVSDNSVRKQFESQLRDWSGQKAPAMSVIATPLPAMDALVGVDAVFIARGAAKQAGLLADNSLSAAISVLNPGDVVYVSGQAAPGELAKATTDTMEGLLRTLKHLDLDHKHVVQIKCFLRPMSQAELVRKEISKCFGEEPASPIVFVEWESGSLPIEIELVAWAPGTGISGVQYLTPPWMKSSPVFSRVARIQGNRRIFVSGLHAESAGDPESQITNVFDQLQRILTATDSDLRHLAKATYYVADGETSGRLGILRPKYYDPKRPPAASKATTPELGVANRSFTMDIIASPKPPPTP